MDCLKPNTLFFLGEENGKFKTLFVPGKKEALSLDYAQNRLGERLPLFSSNFDKDGFNRTFIHIPCGKCISCKLNKAHDRAIRLLAESKGCKHSLFVTLTFENLPPEGALKNLAQLFLKRLRHHYGSFRYFLILERGSETNRPHFHAIIFGLGSVDFDDRQWRPVLDSQKGYERGFTSEKFSKYCWPYGYSFLCDANPGSFFYVAQYNVKSFTNKDSWYLCSRRPGLGANLLTELNAYDDSLYLEGQKYSMPNYFKRKLRETLSLSDRLNLIMFKSKEYLPYRMKRDELMEFNRIVEEQRSKMLRLHQRKDL